MITSLVVFGVVIIASELKGRKERHRVRFQGMVSAVHYALLLLGFSFLPLRAAE